MSKEPLRFDEQHMTVEENKELLNRCKNITACSFMTCVIRRHSTGKWETIIVFFDEEKREPFFAYSLDDVVALQAFIARLQNCRRTMEQLQEAK